MPGADILWLANNLGRFPYILMRGSSPHFPMTLIWMQVWLRETQWPFICYRHKTVEAELSGFTITFLFKSAYPYVYINLQLPVAYEQRCQWCGFPAQHWDGVWALSGYECWVVWVFQCFEMEIQNIQQKSWTTHPEVGFTASNLHLEIVLLHKFW